MSYEDERIVKLTFDSANFKKDIASTITLLEKLEDALAINPVDSSRSFDQLTKAAKQTTQGFEDVDTSVNKVKASLSALQIMGYTVLSELTRSAMSFGKQIYNSTLGQITSGGLSRALNLEAAEFQIEGLGKSWSQVEKDISYGVKDTAYGLDAAAKVASQLLASQVTTGEHMQAALRGISGVAAMTNSTYEDIGSIFTTVAGNGRLMADQLNRLSYRGLNAAITLKDYFNEVKNISVDTEQAMRDMVSKGKVSFQDFANAMNWAFGDHAKEANKTFTGALSNMKAALSRIGAQFQSPWLEFKRQIYVSLIPAINLVQKASANILPIFQRILDYTSGWVEKLFESRKFQEAILNVVLGIYSWIFNILKALHDMGLALPPINDLATGLANLTKNFILSEEQAAKLREIVTGVVKGFKVFLTAIDAIIYILKPFVGLAIKFVNILGNGMANASDTSGDIFDQLCKIIKVVAVIMNWGITKSLWLMVTALKAVKVALGVIIFVVAGLGTALYNAIMAVYHFATDIGTYIDKVKNVVNNLGEGFVKFKDLIVDTFSTAGSSVGGFLDDVHTKFSSLWASAQNMFKSRELKANVVVTTMQKAGKVSEATETSTSKAQQAVTGGLTGGGYLQGFNNLSVISASQLQVAKESMQVADQVDKSGQLIEDSVAKHAKNVSNTISTMSIDVEGVLTDGENAITKSSERKSKSIAESIGNHIQKISNTLTSTFSGFIEHISNVWNLIADAIIAGSVVITTAIGVLAFKLVNGLVDTLAIVPEIFGALRDITKAAKYQGLAEVFQQLSVYMISLAALIAVIGVVAKFVNIDDFVKVLKAISLLIAVQVALGYVISVFSLASAIYRVADRLPGGQVPLKRMMNFGTFLAELSVAIATIVASIMIIKYTADKDGGYTGLLKAGTYVAGILAVIGTFMAVIFKCMAGNNISRTARILDLKTKTITAESTSALAGVVAMLYSLVPIVATITAAVYLLSRQDMDKVSMIFDKFIIGFSVMMSSVFVLMALTDQIVMKGDFQGKSKSFQMKSVLMSVSSLIMALAGFGITIAGLAGVLSAIPLEKQAFVSDTLQMVCSTIGVTLLAILGGFSALSFILSKNPAAVKEVIAMAASFKQIGDAIRNACIGISVVVGVIAVSLGIMSTIPNATNLDRSVSALMKVMAVAIAMVGVVTALLKDFDGAFGDGRAIKTLTNGKVAKDMITVFTGVSLLIGSISMSLGLLSACDTRGLEAGTSALLKIIGLLGAFMVVLPAVMKTFSAISEKSVLNTYAKRGKKINESSKSASILVDNISDFSNVIVKVTTAVSVLVGTVGIVLAVLSKCDPDTLETATLALTTIIGTIGLVMTAFGVAVTSMMSSTNPAKAAALVQTLQTLGSTMLLISGALVIVSGAIGMLAIVFDSIENPVAITRSIETMAGVLLGLTAFYIVINKTANLMPMPQAVYGMAIGAIAIAGLMLAVGAVFKIVSGIENLAHVTIGTLVVVGTALVSLLGVCAIISKFGVVIAASWKAVLVISGFLTVIIGVILGFAYATREIADAISSVRESLNLFKFVDMESVKNAVTQLKDIVATLVEAYSGLGIGGLANAYILGAIFASTALALKTFSGVDESMIDKMKIVSDAIKEFLMAFNDDYALVLGALGVIGMISMTGTFLAGSILSLTAATLAAMSALPLIGMLLTAAVVIFDKLAPYFCDAVESLAARIKVMTTLIMQMWSMDDLEYLAKYLGAMCGIGALMVLAGGLLMGGGVAMLLGGAIAYTAAYVIEPMLRKLTDCMELLKDATLVVVAIMGIGALEIVAGTLLILGSIPMAIGGALLITAAATLYLALQIFNKINTEFDIAGMTKSMGLVCVLAGEALIAGGLLIAASIPLALGGILMSVAGISLMLGIAGLYAACYILQTGFVEATFVAFMGAMTMIAAAGTMLSAVSVPFLIGSVLLSVAIGAFVISTAGLLIGAVNIGLAFMVFYAAFSIIDPIAMLEGCGTLVLVASMLGVVGAILTAALIPLLVGSVIFNLAAVLISTGIIALALSFMTGSAMLMVGGMALQQALNVFTTMFAELDLATLATGFAKLMAVSTLALSSGLILSIGAGVLLAGAVLFLAGAGVLLAGMKVMEQATKPALIAKVVTGIMNITVISQTFVQNIGSLLGGGAIFVAFAGMIMAGAAMLSSAAVMITTALASITASYTAFVEAGRNITEGITQGIEEGKNNVKAAVEDLAEGDVLGAFCDILGIHSPAEEFIKAAANCIGGIVEGFGGNKQAAVDAVTDVGMGMLNGLETVGGKIKNTMSTLGGDTINGFISSFGSNWNLNGIPMLDTIAGSFTDLFSGLGTAGIDAMIEGYQLQIDELAASQKYGEEEANARKQQQIVELQDRIAALQKEKDAWTYNVPNAGDYMVSTPSSSSTTDNSDVLPDAAANAELGKGSSGLGGASGTSSNLANAAASNIGNTITNNNNYNFIQNNYSPEPIDRTELYTQTQNQLNSWYKWLEQT